MHYCFLLLQSGSMAIEPLCWGKGWRLPQGNRCKTGKSQTDTKVEILEGLEEGQEIITR